MSSAPFPPNGLFPHWRARGSPLELVGRGQREGAGGTGEQRGGEGSRQRPWLCSPSLMILWREKKNYSVLP